MTRVELNTYIDDNITDKTEALSLSPTDEGNALKAVADYVDQEVANSPTPSVLPYLYVAPIYQDSTNTPSPQGQRINTIEVGDFIDADYRAVEFGRDGIGQYYVQIKYITGGNVVDQNKMAVLFGDGNIKITAISNGGGGGFSYQRFNFTTYNSVGIASDGVMNGFGFIKIELYP